MDPIELLKLLSAKPVVVGLAVIGALFTCLPYLFSRKASNEEKFLGDGVDTQADQKPSWVQVVNKIGYGLMGVSVFLFIVAGFVVDL